MKRRIPEVLLVSLMMNTVFTSTFADESMDAAPSEELLEFLMAWQTSDQQLIDPFELERISESDLAPAKQKDETND